MTRRLALLLQRNGASNSRMAPFIDLRLIAGPHHHAKWDIFSHDQIYFKIQGSFFTTKRLPASKSSMVSFLDLRLIAGPHHHAKWDIFTHDQIYFNIQGSLFTTKG
jgi:hypothetical protein